MVEVKKANLTEVRCPYCDDFWDYVIPETFFWENMDGEVESTRTVWCRSGNCGKPFTVAKSEVD